MMKLQSRPYRDLGDIAHLRQLVVQGARAHIPASYMHPGCLDWALFYPPDEAANRRDIVLWERVDAGEPALQAFALFSRHERSFDLFVSPAVHGTALHEAVMDEYVAWAEARARAADLRTIWPFWAFEFDTALIALMKSRGFVKLTGLPGPLFERPLASLPDIPVPHGFTVHGVRNLDDGRLRASVTHRAFRVDADWEHYWAEYAQFIGSPVYEGERDLIVVSPDGRGAAACTIWFDAVNQVGLFEPVATHPDFQGRGLGKAVMTEGLRRMKAAGMTRAILGFDPGNVAARALYTSMGFGTACNFAAYEKTV